MLTPASLREAQRNSRSSSCRRRRPQRNVVVHTGTAAGEPRNRLPPITKKRGDGLERRPPVGTSGSSGPEGGRLTRTTAEHQFSWWCAPLPHRPALRAGLPKCGESRTETPEREGLGSGNPTPSRSWLGNRNSLARLRRAAASSDWSLPSCKRGAIAPLSHFPPGHAGSEQSSLPSVFCTLGQAPPTQGGVRAGNAGQFSRRGPAPRARRAASALPPTRTPR